MSARSAAGGGARRVVAALSPQALTPRGWCLLVAGLGAGAAGLALHQLDVLRLAVLLTAAPLVALVVVRCAGTPVTTDRTVSPARVEAGGSFRVRLDVTATGRRARVLAAERVGGATSQPPRFVLEHLEAGASRALTYTARVPARGRHRVGPLRVHQLDALGLARASRTAPGTASVAVLPVVTELAGLGPLAGAARGRSAADGGSRDVAGAGTTGTGTRDYRPGDDRRRVHWRSTARHGELMVRVEDQVRSRAACVLLDVRGSAHHGSGPSGSFEQAVSAAASIAALLVAEGFAVRTTTGAEPAGPAARAQDAAGARGARDAQVSAALAWHRGRPGLEALLDDLVDVRPSPEGLSARGVDDAGRPAPGSAPLSAVVAVMGRLDVEDAAVLAPLARPGRRALAVLVEPPARGAVDELVVAGWEVLALGRGEPLASAWAAGTAQGPAQEPARGPATGSAA